MKADRHQSAINQAALLRAVYLLVVTDLQFQQPRPI